MRFAFTDTEHDGRESKTHLDRGSRSKGVIMAKKLTLILLGISFALPAFISGCNTVAGAGSDLSAAGNKVHDEAREHQRY
jgi:predicted small secreted protein